MKFLKIKYIVPLLIIISAGVIAGLFFIGALEVHALDSDNIKFTEEGFIDFSTIQYDENGVPFEVIIDYNRSKLIGENEDYLLVFDEQTTVATIYKKGTGVAADYSDYEVFYSTANKESTGRNGANLIVDYAFKDSGKSMTTSLNTMQHSVRFFNTLTGKNEGHYKIKYLEDGGVQILYEVGKFSAGVDYFPKHFAVADFTKETTEDFLGSKEAFKYNRMTLHGRFRGNTIFTTTTTEQKNEKGITTHYVSEYTGDGFTYSPAVAEYVMEHNLVATAELTPGGFWKLTGITDEFYDSYGTHINTANSPVTSNPFYYSTSYNTLFAPQTYRDPDITSDVYKRVNFPYRDFATTLGANTLTSLYETLYVSHEQKLRNLPVLDINGNPIIRGGFHAFDENGNYKYDENGKPVQQLYSLEQVAEDNAIYGVESATSLERFQIGLQMQLSDNGLEVVVLSESLRDADHGNLDSKYKHNFILDKISILPEFSIVYPEVITHIDELNNKTEEIIPSEGMIVIPDGSGAVIDFSTWANKTGYADYGKTIYGRDYAFVNRSKPEEVQDVMLGMYGFMDFLEEKGIMAVVEKGGAQTSIFANVAKNDKGAHSAYFNTKLRQNENIKTGGGWHTPTFPKWAKALTDTDTKLNYIFLNEDEMGYVQLANRYREYLIDLYDLEVKDNTRSNLVDLNFLGAFERYDLFLGVRYMKDDSLTTFKQAQEIIEELLSNDVDTLSAGYLSWTKDEMERDIRPSLKVSPALGGKNGMIALNKYLDNKGIKFYPEFNVGTGKGYGYSFGEFKYTARGVGNAIAKQYPYNLATLQINRQLSPTFYLTPSYYRSHIERMLPSYDKLGINGVYLNDLGNMTVGNYKNKSEVYPSKGTLYQMDALELLMNEKQNLKISKPFDYALPYLNLATNIPTEASFYGVFDYAIPFYQLVVNGLVDYTMDYVNGNSDKSAEWFLIKSLETGSNLQFLLSYEDPKILLETDYTMYYKAYYQNWKKYIIDMNKEINDIGIHNGRLVDHKILASGLTQVTYDIPGQSDLVLLLNTSNIEITDGINTYIPYSYRVVGGGI